MKQCPVCRTPIAARHRKTCSDDCANRLRGEGTMRLNDRMRHVRLERKLGRYLDEIGPRATRRALLVILQKLAESEYQRGYQCRRWYEQRTQGHAEKAGVA